MPPSKLALVCLPWHSQDRSTRVSADSMRFLNRGEYRGRQFRRISLAHQKYVRVRRYTLERAPDSELSTTWRWTLVLSVQLPFWYS